MGLVYYDLFIFIVTELIYDANLAMLRLSYT